MTGILRVDTDIGLLTNLRMGLELATGLAHLTGRRLSMPLDREMPGAPVTTIESERSGRPARLHDLWETPANVVAPEEWSARADEPREVLDWGDAGRSVLVVEDAVEPDEPQLQDFANGRETFRRAPESDAEIIEITGRMLAFASYFFFARGPARRELFGVLQAVRVRPAYRRLASEVARDLGRFNAVHLRRSDLTKGIPAYATVSAQAIAESVAEILPRDVPLIVCSEVDGSDELFDPLREVFSDVWFASDILLRDHADRFFDLPRHDDNVLGICTQELAVRSVEFVGTIGSTFTGLIQRFRREREPSARFLYTADYTPDGPEFERGAYVERFDGTYTWNRIGYNMSPDVLSWFREWPEAV